MVQVNFCSLSAVSAAAASTYSRRYDSQPLITIASNWAVVIPLYLVMWLSWIYLFYVSELRHIPTMKGLPLWGQFFDIITQECGIPQRQWRQKYGPIVRYFFPFGAERLVVAHDDALKHITVRNPYNYPKPVRAKLWMVCILGEGVLLAEGAEHMHQRKALAPGFSIQSIGALTPVFWDKALLLSSCWSDEMRETGMKQRSLGALEWLNRAMLDIIGKADFGHEIISLEEPETPIREAYRLVFAFDIFSRILHGLQALIPASKYIPARMDRDMGLSRSIIAGKATDIVNKKRAEAKRSIGGKDIIGLIVKHNKKLQDNGEKGLTFETVRDQIMTFLDPIPLPQEIKENVLFLFDTNGRYDHESLAKADVDQLPYCRESLRYIPPIPMTVRQSLAEDTLAGYRIPAGTVVYVIANAINRLPMYWGPDADKFDPDRWDDLPSTWANNAFMTFLQGPRSCIGCKFAETEMKIILCALLSMYYFKRDETTEDPEDWKMWRLVLRSMLGVNLTVTAI